MKNRLIEHGKNIPIPEVVRPYLTSVLVVALGLTLATEITRAQEPVTTQEPAGITAADTTETELSHKAYLPLVEKVDPLLRAATGSIWTDCSFFDLICHTLRFNDIDSYNTIGPVTLDKKKSMIYQTTDGFEWRWMSWEEYEKTTGYKILVPGSDLVLTDIGLAATITREVAGYAPDSTTARYFKIAVYSAPTVAAAETTTAQ